MLSSPSSSRRHEDYTIAVICAIGFEMSAVRYMLDHEHPRLPPRQGDSNMYILGELSGHNVALACLPGTQGKGAAATVATNMDRTFPSITWRFLVGIGGGVPSDKHDIRLGDIVVSMPEGPYGGVVQYDLGKDAVENFQLKGFLSPPPTRLRSAVEMMRSDHLTVESKVEEFLLQMLAKGPRLSVYRCPSAGQDVLFEADYPHVAGRSSCEDCDSTKTISRLPRQFAGPEVHYGLIASGDRVMKSAAKRNATTASIGDILCFEMEAAGIATEFPCIVIRGISDYADSHKNDIWQHYAAAAAAASAKELLSYIAPREPLSDPATALPGQDAPPPNCNEPLSQQLSGQGIQNAGSFSVGGNLHIQNIQSSNPTHDPYRDFLGDLYESNPSFDMSRIESEKGSLLPTCFDWILDNNELKVWQERENARLLWVKGDPGKGKTMLMIGLVRHLNGQLRRDNCALAFFFCQNADQRLNNGVAILRGLIWMLLSKNPALTKHIPEDYSRIPREKQKAMLEESQNPNLFSTLASMLEGMLTESSLDTVYLLVDALDECQDSDRLVEWMAQAAGKPGSKAKWLVSSRFSLILGRALQPSECQHKLDLELNDAHISRAVARFIEQKVNDLARRCKYDEQLRRKVQTKLEEKAESTFLWVSLICSRLAKVSRLNVEAEIDSFPPGLPAVYDRMMELIERDNNEIICKQILRAATLVYRPLTLEELVTLAELPNIQADDVREAVHLCGSYVILREHKVRFLHQSAKDYLEANYAMRLEAAGVARGHADISRRSMEAMSSMLTQNMYNLGYDFKPVDINPPTRDPLASIRYSCMFWVDHLVRSGESPGSKRMLADDGAVFMFLKEHLLCWLESLSLLEGVPKGVRSIRKLLQLAKQFSTSPQLVTFLEDAEKFVRSHVSIIERAPLQTYGSALVFSPARSEVKKVLWDTRLSFIHNVAGIKDDWDTQRQTLEGHGGGASTVAFSPDGMMLASGSIDGSVRLWDIASGTPRQTLKRYGDEIMTVAFSPDGKMLASGSRLGTMRLWDIASGTPRQALEGYGGVDRAAFSPDGKMLASGSIDGTIRLWDTTSETPRPKLLKGYGGLVTAVAFSPDGKMLTSASTDGTLRFWDTATGTPRQTLKGYGGVDRADGKMLASGSDDEPVWLWDIASGTPRRTLKRCGDKVMTVAFSPDGKTLASGSINGTIRLWDTASGTPRPRSLKGCGGPVAVVAFSPDGKMLASGSSDGSVRRWDTASGTPQQTFKGHGNWVTAVAFSPDGKMLASGSNDGTVRRWDAASGTPQQTFKGHGGWVTAVAFSLDGKMLASASHDETVRLWCTTLGTPRQTLKGHGGVERAAFSPDGKLLASASIGGTVRLWDTATGTPQQTLKGHSGSATAVVFSPDGKMLASTSLDGTVRFWDTASGTPRQTLKGDGSRITAVAFSPDGKMLASGSIVGTVRLWDTATGMPRRTLKRYGDEVITVAFSPDGKMLASGFDDGPVRLWDTVSGTPRQTLKGDGGRITAVAFPPDGKMLASGSIVGTVRLWDTATGTPRQTLKGDAGRLTAVAFSPDGKMLASGFIDGTIQLWDTASETPRQTLQGHGSGVTAVAFSPDGSCLQTDIGLLRLSSAPTSGDQDHDKDPLGCVLSVDHEWINIDGTKCLWLPSDYRATAQAVHGNTIVLGHRSGGLTFLELKPLMTRSSD